MTRDEVLRATLDERGGSGGSWVWTARFVTLADRQFGGRWTRVSLTGDEAGRILLPPHAGEPCHGDRQALVSGRGASVQDVRETLRATQEVYAAANPECWQRIARAADAPFSTVLLTTSPLAQGEHLSLDARPDTLFHLDGFHRLVGWAWAGRLTSDATVGAIVAG